MSRLKLIEDIVVTTYCELGCENLVVRLLLSLARVSLRVLLFYCIQSSKVCPEILEVAKDFFEVLTIARTRQYIMEHAGIQCSLPG